MPPPPARSATVLTQRLQFAQQLHQAGRLQQAQVIYQDILRQNPRQPDAIHYLGLLALQSGRPEDGIKRIEQAISIKPAYPQALSNLGAAYADTGRRQEALACFDKALAFAPDLAQAHDGRGNVLRELGQPEQALASHAAAISLSPNDAGAHSNQGNALRDLRRYQDALVSYDRAIALQPGFIEARSNRAATLHAMGDLDSALSSLDRIIASVPSYPEAHIVRGNVLRDLHCAPEALESFSRAVTLNPASADAHDGKGSALRDLGCHLEAIASHSRAIDLRSDHAAAWYNRGNALASMNRPEAALADYTQALALRPEHAAAWHAHGAALAGLRRDREALISYRKALRLDPAVPWLPGAIAFSRRRICDWSRDPEDIAALEQRLIAGDPVAAPFIAVALYGSAELQRKAAETFARRTLPAPRAAVSIPRPAPHKKIRLAYISADFREHPMMHLMAGLFERHDRDRFELHAICLGADSHAACMQRIRPHFDRFTAAEALTDEQIAALAREQGIDVAIDLMGYTTGQCNGIFQRRAARVQVNWLGYPGTMGADCIDYLIADRTLIPPDAEQAYVEAIVFLPDTYQVNDRRRVIDDHTPKRAEQNLPENAFVFCCFNNSYKITPQTFAGWMRILHHVECSVLWLFQDNPDAADNLRAAAAGHGIAPGRLVFAERLPQAQHLARHRLADLFLDTLPYNAHTTASDALWAGLPVLTRIGDSFAGRVGASLLHAIGLSEMIVTTQQDYEGLAIALATGPARLSAIRDRLNANRSATPLFDTARFTRHLEAAYETMHERAQAGRMPASFRVPALRDPATLHSKPARGPDARSNQNL